MMDGLVGGITNATNRATKAIQSFDRAVGLGSRRSRSRTESSSAANLRAQHGTGMVDLTGLHARR